MLKKLSTGLTTVLLTLALAGNALADFGNLSLIRVVLQQTGGTTEIATNLQILTASSPTNGSFGGGSDAFTNQAGGTNFADLYVAYFAVDNINKKLWITGLNPTISAGKAVTINALTGKIFQYYNQVLGGGTTVLADASNADSYRVKADSTTQFGQFGTAITVASGSRPYTETNLGPLATGDTVVQNLYYFANYATASSGVAVATITTNADGSTTIGPPPPPVNGACGSANGVPTDIKPAAANLCNNGNASTVTGSGPWDWTCSGLNGGAPATCSAPLLQTTTPQSITFGSAPSLTYGGATADVSATATSTLPVTFSSSTPGICTISGSTVTPVSAGTCIIAADQAGDSTYSAAPQATQNITVATAAISIIASNASRVYGAANPTVTGFTPSGLVGSDSITSVTNTIAATATAAATAGSTHTITPSAAVFGTGSPDNYSITYIDGTLTITRATATVSTWPSASAITYGQTLASSNLTGGTSSTVGIFAFTTPATTPNAGTASQGVTFTPTDTNYNTVTGTVSVTVNKATPTVSAWPTASVITYGQTLASSTLSGGTSSVAGTFAFTTPATTPNAGTANQGVTFTPNDANYNAVIGTASVTVNKATPTVSTWPTASSITYGQTLASSTLSGGTSSVAGTFAFTTPTTAPNAGTANQEVTFTPTDTNYNNVSGSVSVTVSNSAASVSVWPTVSAITYGQTLASATLIGGTASVAGTFAFTTPTTVANAGAANQSVTFTPTDTNINQVSGTVSVTVNKANPTVSAWPTASSITYGQTLTSSALSGGTASVAGTFGFTTPTTVPNAGTANQGVTFTPSNANYNAVTGTVSMIVSKAVLTFTANNLSKMVNTVNPTLTYSISGYVNGDTVSVLNGTTPAISTTAVTNSPAGSYPITTAAGTLTAANYSFNYVNGTLTVTPISLTLNPVLVLGGNGYNSIISAIQAVTSNAIILVRDTYASSQPENLLFNNGFNTTLNGGVDANGAPTAGYSTFQGTVTIQSGALIVSNMVIK